MTDFDKETARGALPSVPDFTRSDFHRREAVVRRTTVENREVDEACDDVKRQFCAGLMDESSARNSIAALLVSARLPEGVAMEVSAKYRHIPGFFDELVERLTVVMLQTVSNTYGSGKSTVLDLRRTGVSTCGWAKGVMRAFASKKAITIAQRRDRDKAVVPLETDEFLFRRVREAFDIDVPDPVSAELEADLEDRMRNRRHHDEIEVEKARTLSLSLGVAPMPRLCWESRAKVLRVMEANPLAAWEAMLWHVAQEPEGTSEPCEELQRLWSNFSSEEVAAIRGLGLSREREAARMLVSTAVADWNAPPSAKVRAFREIIAGWAPKDQRWAREAKDLVRVAVASQCRPVSDYDTRSRPEARQAAVREHQELRGMFDDFVARAADVLDMPRHEVIERLSEAMSEAGISASPHEVSPSVLRLVG